MDKFLVTAALLLVCATTGAPTLRAQSVPLIAETPAFIATLHPSSVDGSGAPGQFFSDAAFRAFRAPDRDPLLLPAIGALIGAVGYSYWTWRGCQQTDCIYHPLFPPLAGAVAGGLAGGGVELLLVASGR